MADTQYINTNGEPEEADIALFCDADAQGDDQLLYNYDEAQELAETMDAGDVMELHCFAQLSNKFLVHDGKGGVFICETREAAERIAESTVDDSQDEP